MKVMMLTLTGDLWILIDKDDEHSFEFSDILLPAWLSSPPLFLQHSKCLGDL